MPARIHGRDPRAQSYDISRHTAIDYTAVGSMCPDAFLAEALIYGRALTIPERAAVEAALEARYGIQP